MDLIELRPDSQIIDFWIKQINYCRASLVWYSRRSMVL